MKSPSRILLIYLIFPLLPFTKVFGMAQISMQNNTKQQLNLYIDGNFGCGPALPNGFCTSSVPPGPHRLDAKKTGDSGTIIRSETVTIGDGTTPTWNVNEDENASEGPSLDDSLPEPLVIPNGIPDDVRSKYETERGNLLGQIKHIKAKIASYNSESEDQRTDYQKQNLQAKKASIAKSIQAFNWEMQTLQKAASPPTPLPPPTPTPPPPPPPPTFTGKWRQSTQDCSSAIEIVEDASGNVSNPSGPVGTANGNTLVYQQQVYNPDTGGVSPAACVWTLSADGQSYTYHLSLNARSMELLYIRCP